MKNGAWSGPFAECNPVNCGEPKAEKGAVINCKLGTEMGNTCTLQCPAGFRPPGKGLVKCMPNGKWSGETRCVKVKCVEPPRPRNGSVKCDGDTLGKRCEYGCRKGFNLSGSPTRICTEIGTWTGVAAKCTNVKCAALKRPSSGDMKCRGSKGAFVASNIRYGASCKFSCKYGYNVRGSAARMCKQDGSWSGSTSACAPIDCKPPPAIRGCEFSCSGGTTFGQYCKIKGRKGWMLADGGREKKITCTGRASWSKTNAKCAAATCAGLDTAVENKGQIICSKKNRFGSRCGLSCNDNLVRSGPRVKECTATRKWSVGKFKCNPLPKRTVAYSGVGNRAPAFTYSSVAEAVSVRLESMGPGTKQVYVQLQSTKKGSNKGSWLIGMMKGLGLSVCFGSPSAKKCGLQIDASGTIQFLGGAFFHGKVAHVKTKKKVPKKSKSKVEKTKSNKSKTELGEQYGMSKVAGDLVKLDARLDTEVSNEGEVPQSEVQKVWWNGQTLLQVAEHSKPATKGGKKAAKGGKKAAKGGKKAAKGGKKAAKGGKEAAEASTTTYHTRIGGSSSKTPAGTWKASNGKVSLRIDALNSLKKKNSYLEMRNSGRRDAWGLGMKKDNFHIGYGILGSFSKKSDFISVSPSKDITFKQTVVFHKMPSYFKAGSKLKLISYAPVSDRPQAGPEASVKAKSAMGVPDPPIVSSTELSSGSAAEPVVSYFSDGDVSIKLISESTSALKEAFLEFRTQKNLSWRISAQADGNLHLSQHNDGDESGTGNLAMKITKDGGVHVYGAAYFEGRTMRKF